MDEGDLAKALADRSIVGRWPSVESRPTGGAGEGGGGRGNTAATCFYEDTNKYLEGSRKWVSGRLAQACACFQQIRLSNHVTVE